MRTRMLAACLSLALTACDTEPLESSTLLGSIEDVQAALTALPSAQVAGAHADGVPYMIRGRLGTSVSSLQGASASEAHSYVSSALASITPVFRLTASDLVVRRLSQDEQGHTHLRYAQTKNGLPVVGHELILHVDGNGIVYAANGSARDGESVPSLAHIAPEAARAAALETTPGNVHAEEAPRLVYVRSNADGRLKLAFEVLVTGEDADRPLREHVFVNALDGSIVERTSDIHPARNRAVYSANHTTSLPGTLKISEGGITTGDPVVDQTYAHLGTFYDCFKANFNRDSYNNAGASLTASVHYSNQYTGAFWNGSMLVCGDGDGVTSGSLCRDMDVVNHEYTHAITQYESNLNYSLEPGAISEGMSDIFAAYCESWSSAWSMGPDVFKIAEDVWTPATAGDALRYMCNPTQDGSSKDYYPERYIGSLDNGGVHSNSGIANLAFCLLSQGGTHPRGKTATVVPAGTGVQRAGAIFYRANTDYMTPSTTFAQLKTYTEQVAQVLHGTGSQTHAAVAKAWEAVGVGAPVSPAPSTALTNGVALTGQSGATGSQKFYHLDVPAGRAVTFAISGGTGDVDLYVKFGSQPTTASYGCRPYLAGNNETCTMAAQATAGRYHVMLNGYNAYSGVSLTGTY